MQVILNIIAMFYQLWASWIGVILVAYSRRVISGELRELAFFRPAKTRGSKAALHMILIQISTVGKFVANSV